MPPILVRPVAGLLALWWWVPFFGIIDLTVTWDADWPVMLEAGWGLFFLLFAGLPFMLIAVWPRAAAASVVQLAVSTAVLAVAAAVSLEWQALVVALVMAAATAFVAAVRGRRSVRPWVTTADRSLLGLAAVSLPPWGVYAWQMAAANRMAWPNSDITNSVDHYSVQAAVALTMVAMTAVAGLRSRGRRLHGTCVALTAGYLGLVSFFWPGVDGGFDAVWSVLAMLWGAAVGVAAWWPRSASDTTARPGRTVRAWTTSRR